MKALRIALLVTGIICVALFVCVRHTYTPPLLDAVLFPNLT
jgi:hypothetical protein